MRNEPWDKVFTYDDVAVSRRNRLPHGQTDRGIYFVTFNLFDAVPVEYREELRVLRERLLDERRRRHGGTTIQDARIVDRVIRELLENKLDQGCGSCFMLNPDVADLVDRAIQHFNGTRYRLASSSVMPNHAHAVLRLAEGIQLSGVLHSWKSYTRTMANRILGRKGPFWQEESHDRLVRTSEELARRIEYVVQNPVKAGLRNWRWARSYDMELFEAGE